jgi:hypothetical protein
VLFRIGCGAVGVVVRLGELLVDVDETYCEENVGRVVGWADPALSSSSSPAPAKCDMAKQASAALLPPARCTLHTAVHQAQLVSV